MRSILLLPMLSIALAAPAPWHARVLAQKPSLSFLTSPVPYSTPADLPDAPQPSDSLAAISLTPVPLCDETDPSTSSLAASPQTAPPCVNLPNPYHRFLDSSAPLPLTSAQKGRLAVHNLTDPGNLATIAGTAAFTVGTNAHTAYGPGWKGFGRSAGYTALQDATGEFFGTFLIPSLAHQDPHYHRMPDASTPRRLLHAITATAVGQSDSGARMPNYSTLLTNPVTAEISNLYVPGINGNAPSTAARIALGYGADSLDNAITEFLPDVARRIHVRVIFVQRILNQVSNQPSSSQ